MQCAWATDLHLDVASSCSIEKFLTNLRSLQSDVFFLTGDISNGLQLASDLEKIDNNLPCPGYFVLGNHDYYHRSISGVQSQLHFLKKKWKKLNYLPHNEVISLNASTALLGVDGWSDARSGNYASPISVQDFYYIHELKSLNRNDCLKTMQYLGQKETLALEDKLKVALENHDKLVILLHVPPFEEVALYKGNSDEYWTPFMVCKKMGINILNLIQAFPEKKILILCGHAHTSVDKSIKPNLRVMVGGVTDEGPQLQPLLSI